MLMNLLRYGLLWSLTFSDIITDKPNQYTWTINWEDLGAPDDEPVLPETFDIIPGLKGGVKLAALTKAVIL